MIRNLRFIVVCPGGHKSLCERLFDQGKGAAELCLLCFLLFNYLQDIGA